MVFNAQPVCTDSTDIGLGRVWRRLGLSSQCLGLPEKKEENLVFVFQGSLKVVISVYPYLQKTPNFSRFYKKLGPFYKKLRCDKFGN